MIDILNDEISCPFCESEDVFHISYKKAKCCDCMKEFEKDYRRKIK